MSPDEIEFLTNSINDETYEDAKEIFVQGEDTPAALYLVREGRVKLIKVDGQEEIINAGGFFGEEQLLADANSSMEATGSQIFFAPSTVQAEYTAVAIEKTVCGLLTLEDCRVVFDTTVIGKANESEETPVATESKTINKPEEVAEPTDAPRRRSRPSYYAPPPHPPFTGTLDDLEKRKVLGDGLFGTVWLVTNKNDQEARGYALKIQSKVSIRAETEKAIWSEIEMMKKLKHAFMVNLIASFEDSTSIYMLLTLAPGGELFDVIHQEDEEGNWTSGIGENAKFYAAVIADAIAFMHRQKIVYRDLKPENVLIDSEGYPILTDFGFGRWRFCWQWYFPDLQ